MLNLFQLNKNQYNNTLVIRQKGESENGCSKKILRALKEKFRKIWGALFS